MSVRCSLEMAFYGAGALFCFRRRSAQTKNCMSHGQHSNLKPHHTSYYHTNEQNDTLEHRTPIADRGRRGEE